MELRHLGHMLLMVFGSGAYKNFDGVLAMYHDQGLSPFKALVLGECKLYCWATYCQNKS